MHTNSLPQRSRNLGVRGIAKAFCKSCSRRRGGISSSLLLASSLWRGTQPSSVDRCTVKHISVICKRDDTFAMPYVCSGMKFRGHLSHVQHTVPLSLRVLLFAPYPTTVIEFGTQSSQNTRRAFSELYSLVVSQLFIARSYKSKLLLIE